MARLIFRNGPYANKALTLPEGKTLTIGRNRDLELPLPDLRLSRRHCQIEPSAMGYVLRDLASTNGSFLNGKRVETEIQLSHLDVILIGDTEIEFQMPEAIDQGQTRIGPAATKARTPAIPVRVSPALEPATGPSTAAQVGAPEQIPAGLMPESGTGAVAPVAVPIDPASDGQLPGVMGEDSGSTGPVAPVGGPPATAAPAPMAPAPVPAAAQQQDPLEVAIAELDMPLPPEPSIELPARPQVVFCDQCNGSIPIVHVDLCIAKDINGKLFCRECMAKGVPGGKPGAWPPPEHWGKSASTEDIDDILKGLEQVEEIPQQQHAGAEAVPDDVPMEGQRVPVAGPPKTQSAFERLLEEPEAPKKPKPKPSAPSPEELFGDEFEEIG